jgi:hypothetical protein
MVSTQSLGSLGGIFVFIFFYLQFCHKPSADVSGTKMYGLHDCNVCGEREGIRVVGIYRWIGM